MMGEMLENNWRIYQIVTPPVTEPGINDPITGERDAKRTMSP